jgi:hypothetical protein
MLPGRPRRRLAWPPRAGAEAPRGSTPRAARAAGQAPGRSGALPARARSEVAPRRSLGRAGVGPGATAWATGDVAGAWALASVGGPPRDGKGATAIADPGGGGGGNAIPPPLVAGGFAASSVEPGPAGRRSLLGHRTPSLHRSRGQRFGARIFLPTGTTRPCTVFDSGFDAVSLRGVDALGRGSLSVGRLSACFEGSALGF